MKSNKVFFFLLFLFGLCLFNIDYVHANDIDWNSTRIECIYTDGAAYTTLFQNCSSNENCDDLSSLTFA